MRKADGEHQDVVIDFKITRDMREAIKAHAAKMHLTAAAYCRFVLLSGIDRLIAQPEVVTATALGSFDLHCQVPVTKRNSDALDSVAQAAGTTRSKLARALLMEAFK